MSCKSPSIERAVLKSQKAKEQIEILDRRITELAEAGETQFFRKIREHAGKAGITDFRELIFSSAVKTEYSHEFSLDQMAPVIAKTLEAVAASLSGSALAVITSPHAIRSYSDLVLSITEAAKTKSVASNNLAFSSTRIAPGIYAHLSSKSLSVKDEETFGEESVTATAVLYNLSSSTDDLQQSVRFDLAYLDTELLLKLKHIQIGYADDLAKGEITIAVWAEKDAQIHEAILALRERMNADMYQEIVARSAEEDPPVDAGLFQAEPLRNILEESILAFENRGSVYKTALHKSRELLKKPLV